MNTLQRHLTDLSISQAELAELLGVVQSAVSRKLKGERPWRQREIEVLLEVLSSRCGRKVTYEEIFQSDEAVA